MLALAADGSRISASKTESGVCPSCKETLRAKALGSRHIRAHWAHVSADCDPWSEPESEWHRQWKSRWPVECREVVIGPHRADVRTPSGLVIELQHSSLSSEEIEEREAFYGRMIWILDARSWDIGRRERVLVGYDDVGDDTFPRYKIQFAPLRDQPVADRSCRDFCWRRPRRTWSAAKAPIWLDLGGKAIRVERLDWNGATPGLVFGRGLVRIDSHGGAP